ncbi:hypothetical protein DS909_01540 [Phaeobacter gallaeciensis]|uniref:Uncharacterized protein n=2 Tax=Roseobacteraceae TaxID=2854170 RepID=A0A366X868_9RHOB|nr:MULTISPECIES: hypothetical protein [Roseobacteraceae]MBT3140590.1 hypothetical protein [Falsiruegeria litorea]MBT8170329.1 hypothetical protein [Falsiruegeria litorea]RBW61979.1 hypothetical protein DS909_01540 [Phaeobacter gallaeciensis]
MKNAGVNQQRIQGVTNPVVRTFSREEEENTQQGFSGVSDVGANNSQKIEIVGALCSLDSVELSANFTTPAVLRVPKFKGKPTKLRIKCQKGDLKTDFEVKPQLKGAIVAGPSVAGLVAAAASTAVAVSKDSWSYGANDITVWIQHEINRPLRPLLRSQGCSRDLVSFETINFTQ